MIEGTKVIKSQQRKASPWLPLLKRKRIEMVMVMVKAKRHSLTQRKDAKYSFHDDDVEAIFKGLMKRKQ